MSSKMKESWWSWKCFKNLRTALSKEKPGGAGRQANNLHVLAFGIDEQRTFTYAGLTTPHPPPSQH